MDFCPDKLAQMNKGMSRMWFRRARPKLPGCWSVCIGHPDLRGVTVLALTKTSTYHISFRHSGVCGQAERKDINAACFI